MNPPAPCTCPGPGRALGPTRSGALPTATRPTHRESPPSRHASGIARSRKAGLVIRVAICAAILSTAALPVAASRAIPGDASPRPSSSRGHDRWVRVSYGELIDRSAVIRTGQTLGVALGEASLRGAVQPFVEPYSRLLQDAVQMLNGPDALPHQSVVDQFAPGSAQPAWAAILRSGRIHVVFDGRRHARVFAPGDSPERAYERSYSIIRHCLNGLVPPRAERLEVEVFAYRNDYVHSELSLNTRPYRVTARSFPARRRSLDLAGLSAFFDKGPELAGAQVSKSTGLVLYGQTGGRATLAGEDISLADFAVAYRAVFHAGDNAAYVSLDAHKDPTRTTVNFGGLLEDTRVGSVVLEADKRFKTITSGIDPVSLEDVRQQTRQQIPSFMTVAERDLCSSAPLDGKWVGTRFWFYPDKIGVDTDLGHEYAAVSRPQFTADAERSRSDFASRAEFEAKKAATLSPSIRTNIDHLNSHYAEYAAAFPEIRELSNVARLMGIAAWLKEESPSWLELDDLLAVELPPHATPRERTQLMAASILSCAEGGRPTSAYAIGNTQTTYLSPVLDERVADVFGAPAGLAKYLCLVYGTKEERWQDHEAEASQLWETHRDHPARSLVSTKRDLRALTQFAADSLPTASRTARRDLRAAIDRDEQTLDALMAQIKGLRTRMDSASGSSYNELVDEHNRLVEQHNQVLGRYKEQVFQYSVTPGSVLSVTEIGGGIDLEPRHFRLRTVPESPALVALKEASRGLQRSARSGAAGRGWVRSAAAHAAGPVSGTPLVRAAWEATSRSGTSKSSRVHAQSAGGEQAWRLTNGPAGSWRTLVVTPPSDSRECLYQPESRTLRIAEFHDGHATEHLQAKMTGTDRIVFSRPKTTNLMVPADPPVWW